MRACEVAPEKPEEGAPCNGCGFCCAADPCGLAVEFLDATAGPCPAMNSTASTGTGLRKSCSTGRKTTPATAGIAELKGRTIKSLSGEFSRIIVSRQRKLVNVEPICNAFLSFLQQYYRRHYKGSDRPREYWDDLDLLVGGFGRDDDFPSLFRIGVKENKVQAEFAPGDFGVGWGGQSRSLQRIIRGHDLGLRIKIESEMDALVEKQRESMKIAMVRILDDVLSKLGAELPSSVNTNLPAKVTASLSWDDMKLSIAYGSMPIQDAADFVAWLVMVESGCQKFAHGVPTVGGRTRIGIISKKDGFEELEQPEVEHRLRGFSHDL